MTPKPNRYQILGAAWQEEMEKKSKRSPAKKQLNDTKINAELIQKAGIQGAILQNLKLVLWDLVIASRVNKEAPIDVMPYVERIKNIFEKK